MRQVSYNRAIAVAIGDHVVTIGDEPGKRPWDSADVRLDGEVVSLGSGEWVDFPGGRVLRDGDRIAVIDDQGRVVVAGTQIAAPFEVRVPRGPVQTITRPSRHRRRQPGE